MGGVKSCETEPEPLETANFVLYVPYAFAFPNDSEVFNKTGLTLLEFIY